MNHLPRRLIAMSSLCGAASLLAACGTPPAQPPGAVAEQAAAKPERRYTTGSRLPANSSTQIVRSIGGDSAHETLRSQPNPGRPGF